jgi:lipoprotein NlpD
MTGTRNGGLKQGFAFLSMAVLLAVALTGCGSKTVNRAPVEDRGASGTTAAPVAMDPNTPQVKQPPGFENAGKPGYYTVKPGDTLIRIGLDNGQNWRDIVRWNGIENPNQIEVGQVVRVIPPVAGTVAPVVVTAAQSKPVAQSSATAQPVPAAQPQTQAAQTQPAQTQAAPAPAASAAKPSSAAAAAPVAAAAAASGGDEEISWIWPANGAVVAGFDEVKNKGLDIGGAAGEAVLASADGRVVYVGAGLRGYGNLIILKHNNTYLSAYAHNQTLLVKEDQSVRKGQKIAEMGNSDADRVKLHFEVRRQGKPVDPAKYLPAR